MSNLSKPAEKSKDILVALDRLAHELPIARMLIVFSLFCDCFSSVADGRSLIGLSWELGKEITIGGVLICVASFSFVMTVISPICLRGLTWLWFNIGSPIASQIKSRLPMNKRDNQQPTPEIEESKVIPDEWTELPSHQEKELAKNLVSLPELKEHGLSERDPIALKEAEISERNHQSKINEFEENLIIARWSTMASLLTVANLLLGWRAHSTMLWIIFAKLEQFPGARWIIPAAYCYAVISPLINFLKKDGDLEELRAYSYSPQLVFYPPLAQKLLLREREQRRERELSMRAYKGGWGNARPLELVSAPKAGRSASLELADRLRALLEYLGRAQYCFDPAVTPALVSKILGYDSISTLDAVLSGDRAMSFAESEVICEQFGASASWLLEGKSEPFAQKPKYPSSHEFFQALALDKLTWGDEKPYHRIIFILGADGYFPSLVYGQREQSAHRFDHLLCDVPVYEGPDRSRPGLLHFCLAAAHICRPHQFPDRPYSLSKVASSEPKRGMYQQIRYGNAHPSWVMRERGASCWAEDIWDLNFTLTKRGNYPQAVTDSYDDFVGEMKRIGIADNAGLYKYIDEKIAETRDWFQQIDGRKGSAAHS